MQHLGSTRQSSDGSPSRVGGGFTLVEVLAVIAVLAILAAIVVFSVSGISNRGKSAACRADSRTLRVAVEAYISKHGTRPNNQDQLERAGFLSGTSTQHDFTFLSASGVVITGVDCSSL